jgi:hypothetical protein
MFTLHVHMQVHAVSGFSLTRFKTNNTATLTAHGGMQGQKGDAATGGEAPTIPFGRSFSFIPM